MLHPRRREGHGGECNYDESKNGSSGNNNPLSNPMALMTGGGGGDVFGNMGRHLQLSKDTPALSRSRLPPPREKDKLGTPTSLCTYQPVYTHEKQLQLSRDTRLGIIWHLTNKWLIISTLGTLKEDKVYS